MSDAITNILIVGIGGQGIMTASEIIAQAAIDQGYDVKKTEVAGMAQRGGVVSSHVRFGKRVYSPQIAHGDADILLAFEAAEALRWSSHLKPTGVAMVNDLQIAPPIVSIGLFDYPDDPIAAMQKQGIQHHHFSAGKIAESFDNMKLVNTIMIGAVADHLPLPCDALEQAVMAQFTHKKPHLVELNQRAFRAGQAASQQALSA